MGDFIDNHELYKKLGYDSSNQWIFYEERFQPFFDYLKNLTEGNLLSECEVLEETELKNRNEYLIEEELHSELYNLESEYPGFSSITEADELLLTQQIKFLEHAEQSRFSLAEDMLVTCNEINYQLASLGDNIKEDSHSEKELIALCQNKSKQLEELQSENNNLCKEAAKLFTCTQSPPLFFHQLPLYQYIHKCDSFMQYLTYYLKDNFTIQESTELDDDNEEAGKISKQLDRLASCFNHFTEKYLNEKSKLKSTQILKETFGSSKVQTYRISDIERESQEFQLIKQYQIDSARSKIENDLRSYIEELTHQCMESILYENTKLKLQRALKRLEKNKHMTKIISDALLNAEIIWIGIQLDMEKKKNRFDNMEQLRLETNSCVARIKMIRNLNAASKDNSICAIFLDKMTKELTPHLGHSIDVNVCLCEYEKFGRLLAYNWSNLLKKKSYASALHQMQKINHLEKILEPFVYDSPVAMPMLAQLKFLKPIFNTNSKLENIGKLLVDLRTQYIQNISQKLEEDRFWRYSQVLWIWFLKEPKNVMMAIDELKASATKLPQYGAVKSLGGIKRK